MRWSRGSRQAFLVFRARVFWLFKFVVPELMSGSIWFIYVDLVWKSQGTFLDRPLAFLVIDNNDARSDSRCYNDLDITWFSMELFCSNTIFVVMLSSHSGKRCLFCFRKWPRGRYGNVGLCLMCSWCSLVTYCGVLMQTEVFVVNGENGAWSYSGE